HPSHPPSPTRRSSDLVGYLAALGPDGVAGTDRVAAAAVSALFGPGVARLVAAAILVSMFSATNGLILTTSRVYYAMARDGLFFRDRKSTRLNSSHGSS